MSWGDPDVWMTIVEMLVNFIADVIIVVKFAYYMPYGGITERLGSEVFCQNVWDSLSLSTS